MVTLIIQTILLLAIAFILGAIIGCLLRRFFGWGADEKSGTGAAAGTVAAATTATAAAALSAGTETMAAPAASATPESTPALKTPVVPNPPIPSEPIKPAEKARIETPAASLIGTPAPTGKSADKPAAKVQKGAGAKAEKAKGSTAAAARSAKKSTSGKKAKAPAKTKAAPVAVAPTGKKDNLKLIRGIGPQNEGRLNNLGIMQFAQIAAWKRKDEEHYGELLSFPGRIEREEWVKQAKVLARGGETDFAKRVEAGTVTTSTGTATSQDMGKEPSGLLKAARGGKADNLTLIDGVGNAIEKKMFKLGIFHFDQISNMSKAELVWLGNSVGFPGRPERENWAGESKILASGGTTEHAKKVERGQIKTSRKSD